MSWSADFGLSVTSWLLDSLMKFLRAGRSVRLWINLGANTPDYKRPVSQTIASVLMRRRSLQLLSRLRRFRSFLGYSARCGLSTPGISTIASASNLDSDRDEFSGRAVINNYCVRFSERHSEAAQLLSVSALVAASATRVRVDLSGDVLMTPTDQAQQDEDANLRKIVAQLHVNLGHPSNDALAREGTLDCLEDLMMRSRPRSRFGVLSVND